MANEDALSNFVDRLVRVTPSLGAKLVRTEGVASRSQALAAQNAFVSRLSEQEREQLATLLEYERRCAIHDALVQLHEAMLLGGLVIGGTHPQELDGYTLFQEYISRTSAS